MRLFEQMLYRRCIADTFQIFQWNVLDESPDCFIEFSVRIEVMAIEQFCPLVIPPLILRIDVKRIS